MSQQLKGASSPSAADCEIILQQSELFSRGRRKVLSKEKD